MTFRIFVEGGGNQKNTRTACRRAFSEFLRRVNAGNTISIVASGSRGDAYNDFLVASPLPGTVDLLLVDSEAAVREGHSALDHLRTNDKWTGLRQSHPVHLMTQCMESWFLADPNPLANHFGQNFQTTALPRNPQIESIPKNDVLDALSRAARTTPKQNYSKSRDGFEILRQLDPARVEPRSGFAKQLFDALR